MIAIVILSFYVGMLEGKREVGSSVVLACTEEVLSQLAIAPAGEMAVEGKQQSVVVEEGMFAGSKNGTKYYTPGCAGLDRIKPENIIWFKDAQDATLQGYTPANC